jgi:hypothetical protein
MVCRKPLSSVAFLGRKLFFQSLSVKLREVYLIYYLLDG